MTCLFTSCVITPKSVKGGTVALAIYDCSKPVTAAINGSGCGSRVVQLEPQGESQADTSGLLPLLAVILQLLVDEELTV